MAQATCSVETCDLPVAVRGWCESHYRRWRKTGDPLADVPLRILGDTPRRFWSYVDKDGPGGCWLWTGFLNRGGYGRFSVGGQQGRKVLVHRYSYELNIGPIPDGLQIDHLCRVTACVNPDHLEAVTGRVNTLRSTAPSAIHASKTHCVHGHEFTEANTRWKRNGSRDCRTCARDRRAA